MKVLFNLLARIEWYLCAAVLAVVVPISIYSNVSLRGGAMGAVALMLFGVLLTAGSLFWLKRRPDRQRMAFLDRWRLSYVIGAGLLMQVVIILVTNPVQNSDAYDYLNLANRLAHGQSYMDELGDRAYWPVGLPLFLTPFVFVFGVNLFTVALVTSTLYVISAISVWSIAKRFLDRRAAILTVALFTLWPSRMLLSGLAAKELLTTAAILAGLALTFQCFRSQTKRPLLLAAGAGGVYGFAALAQPGLMLLFLATPLCFRFAFAELGAFKFMSRCIVLLVAAYAVLGVWQLRNCQVFAGEFCGVATNGGGNFYRANNPLASGGWTAEGEFPVMMLPELSRDRRGFMLGKQWILSHPLDAAKLGVKKIVLLLGSDAHGAYWSIYRGGKFGRDVRAQVSDDRMLAYKLAAWISLLFWMAFAVLCTHTLLENWRNGAGVAAWTPLLYPLLYTVCVFAVFESGDRQHIAAIGPLFPLAALAFVGGRSVRIGDS